MSDTAPPFALYNPALLPPEVLLREFTARLPLLERLLDIVRSNKPGEPPQHVLLVGPRGMGKTTLLCAISAKIVTARDGEPLADLQREWQPVIFDEESRRIGDLADFWLECIRQWEATTAPALVQSPRIDALLGQPPSEIEDKAKAEFLQLVDQSGKRALLLIDNINDIFAAISDIEALRRLRAFLMADSRVMIVGAATRWFEDVANVDKPFFEFFRGFDLRALSLDEMRECLAGVAKARGDQKVLDVLARHAQSIEALHILTGGNPRLIRTFYRLLNEGLHGELRQQLERLIDDYTPYHKAIIDALPGQQQRVLDAIALQWNPCDVATVAKQTRLPSNQVSAQIRALSKANLVSEVPALGTQKKKQYMLTDRFSNIHYLMRHGRAGQLRMHWFVMTLRVLFKDEDFADAVANTVRLTANANMQDDALSIAHAALAVAGSDETRLALFDRMAGAPDFDEDVDPDVAERLCREAIERNPNDALAHFKLGRILAVFRNQVGRAEVEYRRAIELDSKFVLAWNCLGLVVQELGRCDEAEAAYLQAIELDPKNVWLWNNLGIVLHKVSRRSEAEAVYHKAIELDSKVPSPWYNLGILLCDYRRLNEAEAAYRTAIELDPKFAKPWNGLGNILRDNGRLDDAEAAYRKAIDLNPKNAWPWNGLGNVLCDNGRLDDAEAAYRKSIQLDPKFAWPHSNVALLLHEQGAREFEAISEALLGLKLRPQERRMQYAFEEVCFDDRTALQQALPEVCLWSSTHPDNKGVVSFLLDAWLAYAKLVGTAGALELLRAQSAEVQLMFETLSDALLAHTEPDHLHRLAPERRAPVLKLLERLKPQGPS